MDEVLRNGYGRAKIIAQGRPGRCYQTTARDPLRWRRRFHGCRAAILANPRRSSAERTRSPPERRRGNERRLSNVSRVLPPEAGWLGPFTELARSKLESRFRSGLRLAA